MLNYENISKLVKTPCFVFDTASLLKRISYLKSKFSKNINLVYAVKANTFIAKELEQNVERYEICSFGEFDICNKLNISHKKMIISGVYKDKKQIENMISNYDDILKYTIESMTQFELLSKLAKKYNRHINVLIRLTSGNQFGVNEEDFKTIIKKHDSSLITIDGIEYFSGTQKHSLNKINREIDYLVSFIEKVETEFNFVIKEVEYGPGLPVFYFQDDFFDEDEFLNELNTAISKIKNKVISLEVGRSIAACCGSYFTKVVDLKNNKNGNYAILDGGINHLVYYGQTMAMKIPHFEVIQKKNNEKQIYNLCGSLCTVNDILVKNLSLNKLEKGDIFVFKNTGAYSATEGIALFLSRDLPGIFIRHEDGRLEKVRNNIKTSNLNFPNYRRSDKYYGKIN